MHRVLVVDAAGSTEINQLDDRVFLVFKVDVLGLDVTVDDAVYVQVVHGRDKLLDYAGCLDLVKGVVSCHSFVEGASMHHLVDKVDLLLVFVHLDDLPNVGVIQSLEQFNFFKELAALSKLKVLFADNFNCAGNP